MPSPSANRRPIKSRDHRVAQRTATWLNRRGFTPNEISLASIAFAAFGALMLVAWRHATGGAQWLLPLLAIIGIQGRLLCNLFDGMVAVEGGRSTPAGELYNDMPDRAADALLLVAAGYAASALWSLGVWLGWLAALLAVATAYVRVLGASMGAPMRFSGPMAKQHRMALLSGACLLSVLEPYFWPKGIVMLLTVVAIAVGSAVTIARRTRDIHEHCESAAAALPAGADDV
ncbi:CDP-alcohol phosphatidyltransferase family protein [Salinicola avicenniae]|uniref:CDP-alcohol phosphatidyltransferase family protein n=1 Tax=Salinicola avicenniae TaxID=2916836 RepID=UPI002073D136|nr:MULTISPECIES: CDP-alcohol phosphatidyltransferase family protein [unclassified Salinicola]